MGDDEKTGEIGVLGDPQAPLFENLADDAAEFEESSPFVRVARRGGGSRKGVPNRRTEDFKKYYQSLGFRDPLLFLGHVVSQQTVELARELQCKPAAALEIQRKAADGLAPYLHSKQPVRVEVPDDGRALLVIGEVETRALHDQVAAGAISIDGELPPVVNQPLSAPDAPASHERASHEVVKVESGQ